MAFKIEDGGGTGRSARVTKDKELLVESHSLSQQGAEAVNGNAYFFATDFIEVSGTSERPLIFIQTSADTNFHISQMRVSTNIPGVQVRLRGNPTSRQAMVSAVPRNTNLGSGKKFKGRFETATVTASSVGGNLLQQVRVDTIAEVNLAGELILGPEDSIIATVQPSAAGNVTVGMSITGYFHDSTDD